MPRRSKNNSKPRKLASAGSRSIPSPPLASPPSPSPSPYNALPVIFNVPTLNSPSPPPRCESDAKRKGDGCDNSDADDDGISFATSETVQPTRVAEKGVLESPSDTPSSPWTEQCNASSPLDIEDGRGDQRGPAVPYPPLDESEDEGGGGTDSLMRGGQSPPHGGGSTAIDRCLDLRSSTSPRSPSVKTTATPVSPNRRNTNTHSSGLSSLLLGGSPTRPMSSATGAFDGMRPSDSYLLGLSQHTAIPPSSSSNLIAFDEEDHWGSSQLAVPRVRKTAATTGQERNISLSKNYSGPRRCSSTMDFVASPSPIRVDSGNASPNAAHPTTTTAAISAAHSDPVPFMSSQSSSSSSSFGTTTRRRVGAADVTIEGGGLITTPLSEGVSPVAYGGAGGRSPATAQSSPRGTNAGGNGGGVPHHHPTLLSLGCSNPGSFWGKFRERAASFKSSPNVGAATATTGRNNNSNHTTALLVSSTSARGDNALSSDLCAAFSSYSSSSSSSSSVGSSLLNSSSEGEGGLGGKKPPLSSLVTPSASFCSDRQVFERGSARGGGSGDGGRSASWSDDFPSPGIAAGAIVSSRGGKRRTPATATNGFSHPPSYDRRSSPSLRPTNPLKKASPPPAAPTTRIDTRILDDFETRFHKHYSVFSPDGVESSNPPLLHYLHLGRWCTLSCEYFLHRFPADGESRGHTVMWLHTARPRNRFVFLISPVEATPQQTLMSRLWRLLYGAPPNFALSGGRVLWNDGDREEAMVVTPTTYEDPSSNTAPSTTPRESTAAAAGMISQFAEDTASSCGDEGRLTVSALSTTTGGGCGTPFESKRPSPLAVSSTAANPEAMMSGGANIDGAKCSVGNIGASSKNNVVGGGDDEKGGPSKKDMSKDSQQHPQHAPLPPRVHVGITALEVLHDDVTAMDFAAQLMSSRLSLETKLATCRWFSSKEAALRHYDALDKLPFYTQVKSGGVSGVHMRQRMKVVQRLQARRKLDRYMPRSGPAVGYPIAGVPIVRKPESQFYGVSSTPAATTQQQHRTEPSVVMGGGGSAVKSTTGAAAKKATNSMDNSMSAAVFRVASSSSAATSPQHQQQQHYDHTRYQPLLPSKKSMCMGFSGDPRFSVNVDALTPSLSHHRPASATGSPSNAPHYHHQPSATTSSSVLFGESPPVSYFHTIRNVGDINHHQPHHCEDDDDGNGDSRRRALINTSPPSGATFSEQPPPFSLSANVAGPTARSNPYHGDCVGDVDLVGMGGGGVLRSTTLAAQDLNTIFETTSASNSYSDSFSMRDRGDTAGGGSSSTMATTTLSPPTSSRTLHQQAPLLDGVTSSNKKMGSRRGTTRRSRRPTPHTVISPASNSSFPPVSPHVVSAVIAHVQSRFGGGGGAAPKSSSSTFNKDKGPKKTDLNTRPNDGHVTSLHSNTIVVLYSQDPHFTHMLRELLAPESGTVPVFTATKASQQRLLSLCEAGMPSWTIFFSRWGLPYRRWFRLIVVTLVNIWPLIALCVGAYDLYKHMPHLKNFMAHWFAPISEWINENFALSVSIYLTYMMSVSLTVFQSLHSLVRTFTHLVTVVISPMAPLFNAIRMLYPPLLYLLGLIWALLSPIVAIGRGLVHLVLSPYYFIRWVLSFAGLFVTPGAGRAVQSASSYAILWRYWMDFWETVARPVKNLAKASYDGIVHVGVAISKRDASMRLIYRATVPKLHRLLSLFIVEWFQLLSINARLMHSFLPHGTGRAIMLVAVVLFAIIWNWWENSDAAYRWEMAGWRFGRGGDGGYDEIEDVVTTEEEEERYTIANVEGGDGGGDWFLGYFATPKPSSTVVTIKSKD